MRIVCRLFGHDWFGRRAFRRVEWIGDNTGRLRQVTTCGRCLTTRALEYRTLAGGSMSSHGQVF